MSGAVAPGQNPFRSACLDALDYVSPGGDDFEQIVARYRQAGFRGALVGPHGHGKSTLMHQLAGVDPPAGQGRYPVIQVMADGSNRGEVKQAVRSDAARLLVDGYDLLPWRLRRALAKRPGVLVTSHEKTPLPTLVAFETTPGLLGTLIERLSPAVFAGLSTGQIVVLHARHDGNLRDALRQLYDRVAEGELGLRQ